MITIAFFGFAAFTHSSDNQTSPTSLKKRCHLTLGWTEWKPLQYYNNRGELEGLQIDFIREIAKQMGCKLSYVEGNWQQLLDYIKSGEIDFIADATATTQRKEFALFSVPFRRDSFTVYVRTKERTKYQPYSLEQLKLMGFKLALTEGYLYGGQIELWKNDKKYNQYLSYAVTTEENMKRLSNNEIDGFVEDPLVVSYKMRSGDKELSSHVSPLSFRTFGLEASFMFSKKTVSKDLVKQFNQALLKVQSNPVYQSIWFNDNK